MQTGRVKTGAACKKRLGDGSGSEWKGQGSRIDRKEERNPPCCGNLDRGSGLGQSGVSSGSKGVQVKGFMLLSQPKPGKHRPAKPCGKAKVHNFFRDTEIFYT